VQNDIYSVKLKLQHPIPEYLPIRGKKAKVYYHGMLPFCSNCHTIGHQTVNCENNSSNWWTYIEKLKQCDIPLDFFGSWISDNNSVQTSTPTRSLNQDEVKAQFISFMQEFVQNPAALATNKTQQPPEKPAGRFDALYKFSPQLQASIDSAKKPFVKNKFPNKKRGAAAETAQPQPQPQVQNKPYRGRGRGGRGGRGGGRGNRGGRGGRGGGNAGAIAV